MLISTGQGETFKSVEKFFEYYLTARQINDDAHDWQQDLKKGQINYVGSKLIKRWLAKNNKAQIDLKKDLPNLNKFFWERQIKVAAGDILKHIQLAQLELKKNKFFSDPEMLEKLLTPIELSAQQALHEQKQTSEFLKSY